MASSFALRSASAALLPKRSPVASRRLPAVPVIQARRGVRVAASSSDAPPSPDFDAVLAGLADKFEKAENKPAIVGYLAGAVAAVVFTEWLIHLPGLNVLLGWPIQLLGVFTLPVLAVRYYVESGNDLVQDVEDVVKTASKQLPGLDK